MIVRCWMTSHPLVVVEEDTTLEEAFRLMRSHGIRRLPVVKGGELRGIITLSDLYSVTSIASLSGGGEHPPAELGRHLVRDVMASQVFTCDVNAPLEDVGALMRREKVGALPVMNGTKLAGIITESDVLEALVSITRVGRDTRRIYLRIPVAQRYTIFQKLIDICRTYGIEIYTVLTHPMRDSESHLVMLKFSGDRTEDFVQALWESDYQVMLSDELQSFQ